MNPSAVDLSTTYLGLTLRSPLVASPSPLTGDIDSARRLAAAGVGALVLPSLFEEEIVAEELSLTAALEAGAGVNPEATNYFPPVGGATLADRYLANLERIKSAVDVPVIASLNATSVGAWTRYAELVARAGADAVELNVYRVAANPQFAAADIETADLELISDVCAKATVPVAVKLSPYYSSMAHFVHQVIRAGASGLVLFNRFYQPDIDLETMDVECRLQPSTRPQRAVGANAVMMTSELLRSGPERVAAVERELRTWLAEHEYDSAAQLRGSVSRVTAEAGEAFERANYMATLRSWVGVGAGPRR